MSLLKKLIIKEYVSGYTYWNETIKIVGKTKIKEHRSFLQKNKES